MSERTRELRRIIGVLVAGVIAAFALAAFFVLEFGPSGRYVTSSILLSPQVLSDLNYNDYNPVISEDDRYIFDKFSFVDVDIKNRQDIDISQYEKIYSLIKADKSLTFEQEINELFNNIPPAVLTIYVKTESPSSWQKDRKIFQEIQFSGLRDYYRIELHEENKGKHWVYFHHPEILQKIREIIKL